MGKEGEMKKMRERGGHEAAIQKRECVYVCACISPSPMIAEPPSSLPTLSLHAEERERERSVSLLSLLSELPSFLYSSQQRGRDIVRSLVFASRRESLLLLLSAARRREGKRETVDKQDIVASVLQQHPINGVGLHASSLRLLPLFFAKPRRRERETVRLRLLLSLHAEVCEREL